LRHDLQGHRGIARHTRHRASLNSGSGSANHSKNNNSGVHCSCNSKKTNSKMAANKWWPFARLKNLLCGLKEPEDLAAQSKWNNQVRHN
jgi:hypothetical protein